MASSPRTQAYISGVIPYDSTEQEQTETLHKLKTHCHVFIKAEKDNFFFFCAFRAAADLKPNTQQKQKWDLFSVEQQEHLWRLQPWKSKSTPLKEEVKKEREHGAVSRNLLPSLHPLILLCRRSNWDIVKVVSGTWLLGVAMLLTLAAGKRHRNQNSVGCLCDSVTLIQELEETFDLVPLCYQNRSFKLLPVCFSSPCHHTWRSHLSFSCFFHPLVWY